MPCTNDCVFDGSDTGVCCNICDKWFHTKCAGLSVRIIELLSDNSRGIFFFCVQCRKSWHNLCSSHKTAKKALGELSSELSTLQGKLAVYTNAFEKVDSEILEKNLRTVKNKSKNLKKRIGSSHSEGSVATDAHEGDDDVNVVNDIGQQAKVQSSHARVIESRRPTTRSVTSGFVSSPSMTPNDPSSTPAPAPLPNNTLAPVLAPSPTNTLNPDPPAPNPDLVSSAKNDKQSTVKALRVILPRKSIFVGRLAEDTTVDDVKSFIASSLPNSSNISVKKFEFSFKRLTA